MTVGIAELGKRTLVMGILNITPDSFSDGGKFYSVDQAVIQAKKMIAEGADILDIGGESTRPGFQPTSVDEEVSRVLPVILAIRHESNIAISIDTSKAEVANQAVSIGANIINDISGCKLDSAMPEVAAKHQVPIILMHNRDNREYGKLMIDIVSDLQESVSLVQAAGVTDQNIWIDPGIGFAKDYEQNLTVLAKLDQLVALGYPVLLGTSRKGFIGLTLDLPVEERVEGSLATVCYGIQKGCQIVRVHDVKETARVCRMMDAIIDREDNHGHHLF